MRRFLMGLALLTLLAAPVHAQDDGAMGGYDKMSVKAGLWIANINTQHIQSLSKGAHIVLKTTDGSKPDLPISADTITFTWKEGKNSPTGIVMVGNVDIQHTEAKVTAERADWDLETGDLVFTGNPVMDSMEIQGLRAEKVRINLNTGALEIVQGEAKNASLMSTGGGKGTPIPGELTEADITDWAGFINAIKTDGKASGENPGKQLLSRLDEKTRNLLRTIDTPTLVSNKGDILKKLNGVIRKPGLFKRSAWKGISLSDEMEALLKKSKQTPEEQVRQNRFLLHAAYPDMIKAP